MNRMVYTNITSQPNLHEVPEPRVNQLTHTLTVGQGRSNAHEGKRMGKGGRSTSLKTKAAAHGEGDPRPRAEQISPRPE